jgi:hypothetical protein
MAGMPATANSPDAYVASLPEDRRAAIEAVRDVVRANLPDGYDEVVQYGMLSWVVPLGRYAATHNGQPLASASLASQKRHMALYLTGIYSDEASYAWLRDRWATTGKRLDMGKSCLRFRTLDDLDLPTVAEAISRFPVDTLISAYERSRTNP